MPRRRRLVPPRCLVLVLRCVLLVLVGGRGQAEPAPPPQPPAAEAASWALLLLRAVLWAGLSGLPTPWLRPTQQPGVRVWAPPVPGCGRRDHSATTAIITGLAYTLANTSSTGAAAAALPRAPACPVPWRLRQWHRLTLAPSCPLRPPPLRPSQAPALQTGATRPSQNSRSLRPLLHITASLALPSSS